MGPKRDTTYAAEQVRVAAVRRMDPAERLRQAFRLSESVRQLALAGLRERHPERTDIELIALWLGRPVVPDAVRPPRR